MEEKKEKSNAKQAAGYSKEQILKSARYEAHRDILEVMLEEGKNYSHEQIRDAVSKSKKER